MFISVVAIVLGVLVLLFGLLKYSDLVLGNADPGVQATIKPSIQDHHWVGIPILLVAIGLLYFGISTIPAAVPPESAADKLVAKMKEEKREAEELAKWIGEIRLLLDEGVETNALFTSVKKVEPQEVKIPQPRGSRSYGSTIS